MWRSWFAAVLSSAFAACGGAEETLAAALRGSAQPSRGAWAPGLLGAGLGTDFVVMVDFGSSGSRLFVYLVERPTFNLQVVGKFDFEALATFANRAHEAKAVIQRSVVASYTAIADAQQRKQTPIYAFATAGMRLLPEDVSVPLWVSVREALRSTEYKFSDVSHARTMSGDLEGVYQWVTVNQLLGSEGRREHRGILELGGASLQAAFEPATNLQMIMQSEFRFRHVAPSGRWEDISLYADSWLGFGSNEALSRLLTFLFESGTTTNPCFNLGFERNATLYGHTSSNVTVLFTGSGEPSRCSELVRRSLIHSDWECIQKPCGIAGRYFPQPGDAKFIGVSGFFHTPVNLNLMQGHEAKAVPLNRIIAKTEELCALTPEQVADNPDFNHTSWERFQWQTCFTGHLHYWVLRSFGFTDEGETIEYRDKIHGEDVTWTQGGVLYEAAEELSRGGALAGRILRV